MDTSVQGSGSSGGLEVRLEPARDTARGQGWEATACVGLFATRWRATCAATRMRDLPLLDSRVAE